MKEIENNSPIMLNDGKFGLCIRFASDSIGVQVPGEGEIRWIEKESIKDLGNGALLQVGGYKRNAWLPF